MEKKRFVIERLEDRIAPSACNGIIHSLGGKAEGFNNAPDAGQDGILNAAVRQIDACIKHG